MRRKKWTVAKCDKDFAATVAQELCADPFAALIATSRGLGDINEMDYVKQKGKTLSVRYFLKYILSKTCVINLIPLFSTMRFEMHNIRGTV